MPLKAEPKDLRVLTNTDEASGVLARRHHIAGRELKGLASLVPEFGRAADHAVDHDLALGETCGVRR